ncbi:rhodanese-like domain-containing protein [Corallibacter sp.]|uniref:rhodanese-like domain-containing protein n=1 Tax=Corallibacter sp. TaxID=2038084 RepID=UPI003AB8A5BE
MKHLATTLSLMLFFSILLSCQEIKKEGNIEVITAEEMQSILDLEDIQLVDVRTPEEFKEGFIANAQNIDYFSDTFDEDIEKLDKSKPVIVYCKSGGRSAKCADKLLEAGFVKVYDLEGGISKWKHKGLNIKTFE